MFLTNLWFSAQQPFWLLGCPHITCLSQNDSFYPPSSRLQHSSCILFIGGFSSSKLVNFTHIPELHSVHIMAPFRPYCSYRNAKATQVLCKILLLASHAIALFVSLLTVLCPPHSWHDSMMSLHPFLFHPPRQIILLW